MVPRHVAYIMDGNGRWAARRGLPRSAGYKEGLKAMLRVLNATEAKGADTATVYAFSAENVARPAEERAEIMRVVKEWCDGFAGEWKVSFIGDLSLLPHDVAESAARLEERSASSRGLHLVIALGYGGREDIVRAANTAAKQGEITRESLESALSTHSLPPLDLIVRSGGEKRLSGFMLYEAAYSELVFLDKLWPDMTEDDVEEAFAEFARRTRKFGA